MRNLVCWLVGHDAEEIAPCIEQCKRRGDSVDYYADGDWTPRERYGVLDPLRTLGHRLRRWSVPRCDQCGKLLLFRRTVGDCFCSEECMDTWLPF